MKLLLATFTLILLAQNAKCQYYYNDIIILKETNRQYLALKNSHITKITAQSLESDNEPTKGFLLQQDILDNASKIVTTSELPSSGRSVSTNYYEDGHITKTVDNSNGDSGRVILSVIEYSYDTQGNITENNTVTADTFMNSRSEEVHRWFYTNNSPAYMLRIKDRVDTTMVEFVKDEQGNIAEEHWKKNGRRIEDYFYYYNDQHLLTDIVRFNNRVKRMLPDFLFEYDGAGKLTKLTQIQQNSSNYLTWYYEYNSNGLKQKETCYDKLKQLIGRIDYSFQ